MADLLTPLPDIPEDQQHWAFRLLIAAEKYAPARDMLRQVWAAFPNPDRHFIREFQTAGFDARVWELVLTAVGYFGTYKISRPHEAPDFFFDRDGVGVWIEATTANPSAKPQQEVKGSVQELETMFHEMNNVIPIRLGSALYSKLSKAYWNQAHVAGQPFVIAIEDFADDGLIRVSGSPLFKYLYGMDHKVVSRPGEPVQIEIVKIAAHRHGDKVIPSGFFDLPGADNVSAVIFSNEGTIPKFNRMGFDFAKHSGVRMVRVGLMMDFDPSATVPAAFGFLVGDFGEEWGHGMSVYHNPNAKHPIPVTFFDGFSSQYRFENGEDESLFREFSPYSSLTVTYSTKGYERKLPVLDQLLREEADKKSEEYAAIINDGRSS